MKKTTSFLLVIMILLGCVSAWAELPSWAQYDGGMKFYEECPVLPDPRSFVDGLFACAHTNTKISNSSSAYNAYDRDYATYGYMMTNNNRTISDAISTYATMLSYAGFRVMDENSKFCVYNGFDKLAEFMEQGGYFIANIFSGYENLTTLDRVQNDEIAEARAPKETQEKYCYDGKQCLVVDQEDIKVYLTGTYSETHNSYYGQIIYIDLIVENNTDYDLTFFYDGTVNGWSVGHNNTMLVNGPLSKAHSKMKSRIAVNENETYINSIAALECLELTFRGYVGSYVGKLISEGNTGLVHLHAK